jgi:hypothetical protein
LSSEDLFANNEPEWLFQLLGNSSKDVQAKIIFLLWRTWHHRNNIIHGDGKALVSASVNFLVSYEATFAAVAPTSKEDARISSWTTPPLDTIKANTDGGWHAMSKNAGIGVVIRDHRGQVVLAEWKFIPSCSSSEEAEILVCLEGLNI